MLIDLFLRTDKYSLIFFKSPLEIIFLKEVRLSENLVIEDIILDLFVRSISAHMVMSLFANLAKSLKPPPEYESISYPTKLDRKQLSAELIWDDNCREKMEMVCDVSGSIVYYHNNII